MKDQYKLKQMKKLEKTKISKKVIKNEIYLQNEDYIFDVSSNNMFKTWSRKKRKI